MKKTDFFVGIALILLSVAVWITSGSFPSVGETDVGPSFFPRLIAGGLVLLSLIMIAGSFRHRQDNDKDAAPTLWGRTILGFVCMFAFLALIYIGGFHLATPLFLFGFMWLYGYRKPMASILVAVLVTLFIYFIFEVLLQVPLPAGVLFE
ncbi:tripartite tricarboxylate transporter TctB family protein [Brevibacillus marinus]|uniref:tripartite tricarboxylate transporter TctB family protein n=1 Tax=Brevibacillus marinus TaxID=2496837 RepID=UPI000F831C92|nr:tripartite tricarboxylate transporter TctB family protein [Brevibacillus marinus]